MCTQSFEDFRPCVFAVEKDCVVLGVIRPTHPHKHDF